MALNHALFGPLRWGLKATFPDEVPIPVLRVLFGVERRVWFGSNRLKNDYAIECLVVAT